MVMYVKHKPTPTNYSNGGMHYLYIYSLFAPTWLCFARVYCCCAAVLLCSSHNINVLFFVLRFCCVFFRPNPLSEGAENALAAHKAMLATGKCPVCQDPLPDGGRGFIKCVSVLRLPWRFTLPSPVYVSLLIVRGDTGYTFRGHD